MEFGLPSKKVLKKELYPNNAIITVSKTEENKSNRISFNKAAYTLLKLNENETNEIAISFTNAFETIFIMNANEFDSNKNFKVNKNGSFAHKKCALALKKAFNIDEEEELELEIEITDREFQNNTIFKLTKFEKDLTNINKEI